MECDHYGYSNRILARSHIEAAKDFLSQYVVITNIESDAELVVLVDLAIYLHALEQKCVLNRSIPNEILYREKLLSADEMNNLQEHENEGEELPGELVVQIKDSDGNIIHECSIKTKN